ncbi:Metal-dependent hydrolase YbeY, involved in rRNA and/or ribosome maturation and assembly [hydrothermal vent metagenome]|uniref:Metal-dependent hydrolase YbeY, involved in rRNA and/or ribosome maturation and assembly n=1 Tax=hydrothermal vent metagenome TaxID=652676 RepID=A0A3B0WTL9_9ZZZZ
MSIQLDIQLADDLPKSLEEPPSRRLLCLWAQTAWQGNDTAESNLSLRIVSTVESQQLNHDYRGKNTSTNVLSFPMQMETDEPSISNLILGDLAICAEVVEREAQQQHIALQAHWAHMVVHGMLHLQGFDHIQDSDAEQMEKCETKIMLKLGFANPYLHKLSDTDDALRIET